MFTTKSAEFREAISSILGVKLAFYPNGQVRVTSSFDLNAAFVFQPARAGGEGPVTSRVKVAAGIGTYHVASAGVGAGWEEGDGLWNDVLGGRFVG